MSPVAFSSTKWKAEPGFSIRVFLSLKYTTVEIVEWYVSEVFTLYFWLLIFPKYLFSITNMLACFLYPSYTGLLVWQSPSKTSIFSVALECKVELLNSSGLSAHFPKVCSMVTFVLLSFLNSTGHHLTYINSKPHERRRPCYSWLNTQFLNSD